MQRRKTSSALRAPAAGQAVGVKYFDGDWNEREDSLDEDVVEYQARRLELESWLESGKDARRKRSEKEIADYGRCVGQLGEAYRLSGFWAAAFEARTAALAIWTELQRPRAIYLARLRLAILQESIRASGTPTERSLFQPIDVGYATLLELRADLRTAAAEATASDTRSVEEPAEQLSESEHIRLAREGDLSVYADFVHEALAIALLRRGEYDPAHAEFAEALAIRRERGQRAMIKRTRELIDRLEQLARG